MVSKKNADGFLQMAWGAPAFFVTAMIILFCRLPDDATSNMKGAIDMNQDDGDDDADDMGDDELDEAIAGEALNSTGAGSVEGGGRSRRGRKSKAGKDAPFDIADFFEGNLKILYGHMQVFSSLNVSFQIQ